LESEFMGFLCSHNVLSYYLNIYILLWLLFYVRAIVDNLAFGS
jgi:hypothetical protein